MKKTVKETEKARVADMLKRDREDAESEQRRKDAETVQENGGFATQDIVVPPTPEWLAKHETAPYTPKGEDNTVRTLKTVRRVITDNLVVLYQRGVLDDDLFSACRWYRDRYEAAELSPSAAIASYGESIRGDMVYGHLPRTLWGVEARRDYLYAQGFITPMFLTLFELVCLHSQTLKAAASTCRMRSDKAAAYFQRGALDLHGAIANRLKIEPGKPEEIP